MCRKFNLLTGEISDVTEDDMQEDHEGYLKKPFFYHNPGSYFPCYDNKGEYTGFMDGNEEFVPVEDCEQYVEEFQWVPETD